VSEPKQKSVWACLWIKGERENGGVTIQRNSSIKLTVKVIAGWLGCFLIGWLCSRPPEASKEATSGSQSTAPSSLLPETGQSWRGELTSLSAWFGVDANSRKTLVTALLELDTSKRLVKFRELAEWNPNLAADLARAVFDHSGNVDGLAEVLKRWAIDDPSAAGRRLVGLPKAEGNALTKALVKTVAKQNPWAMGALMLDGDAASWPKRVQEEATYEWSKHDPDGAAAWMTSLDEEMMKRLASKSLSNFTVFNEVGGGWEAYLQAFGHLNVLEDRDARRLDGGVVSAQSWEEALSFMKSLSHPSAQAAYLASFIGNRQMIDVEEARRLFDENVPASMKARVAQLLGPRLASGGDDAWAWMGERPDSFDVHAKADFLFHEALDSRDGKATRSKLVELIADLDPEEAIPKNVLNSVDVVSAVGVMYDLPDTLTWVKVLENESVKQRALMAMASRSQDSDPAITSEIISEIAPGEKRDQLIKNLVGEIQDDPERAFQWASVVDTPALREQLARRVLDQYWEATPEMLERTIQGSALTDAEKARLQAAYVTGGKSP
jgi:hypothetical protein